MNGLKDRQIYKQTVQWSGGEQLDRQTGRETGLKNEKTNRTYDRPIQTFGYMERE